MVMIAPSDALEKPEARRKAVRVARQVGEQMSLLCEARSGVGAAMRAYILAVLDRYGPSWGEDIVDSAREAGIHAHDDRAWGPSFATLARQGLITKVAYGPRKKGRGTGGAIKWARVAP